jgi:MoxR-like ATPase
MENTKQEILQEKVNIASKKIKDVISEVHKKIVGQDDLIKSMLIALFAKGHILIE